jgi:nicotinamide mononucleotide transporter
MKRFDLWLVIALGTAMVVASWRGWLPYDLTETLGFVTGAACVYLVVIQNIWNFPVGIANNVFFLVLFAGARLYGDAGLQIVYIALGFQGWYLWLHGGEKRTALRVEHASRRMLAVLGALVIVGTLALTLVLRLARGSAPVLDAFTTVLSLAAQYLLNRKAIESWYLWIAADVIYIYLYIERGLQLTAVLYFVFLCLCVVGLRAWLRSLKEQGIDSAALVDVPGAGGAAQVLSPVRRGES